MGIKSGSMAFSAVRFKSVLTEKGQQGEFCTGNPVAPTADTPTYY